ncbi:MAG: hypothetical protein AAF527_11930, partial [Pseudomonadota bacterium]
RGGRTLIGLASLVAAIGGTIAAAFAVDFEAAKDLVVSGRFKDVAFVAGETVRVEAKGDDEMFVAGGEVVIDGGGAKTLFVAGGDVRFSGVAADDIIAAGGDLAFRSGAVADDVVAAGGDMRLGAEFELGGAAVLAGGSIAINAPVGADLQASAGDIALNAAVGGDALISAGKLYLGPSARIAGDLNYKAREFEMHEDAVVEGEIIAVPLSEDDDEGFEGGLFKVAATAAALFALSYVVLNVAAATALPALMAATWSAMRARPLSSVGLGFVMSVGSVFVVGFLFATLIGLPLGFLLMTVLAAATPVGGAAVAYGLGQLIRSRFGADAPPAFLARAGWTALGSLILMIVLLIPFLGVLALIVASLMGLGAVVSEAGRLLSRGSASA